MAPATATTVDVEPDDFTANVARNIRTVLAMRRMSAKAVAAQLGMSETKFSQRMSGGSRWLALDLARLARVLDVSMDVITAQSDDELRSALAQISFGYKPDFAIIAGQPGEQMELSYEESPFRPLAVAV